MARYDIYAWTGSPGLLLDCQANVLNGLNTRFVVPLLPVGIAPVEGRKLNPRFNIGGKPYAMVTQ